MHKRICTRVCQRRLPARRRLHLDHAAALGTRQDLPDRRIIVESAGTSGGIGGAAENAITVMKARGLDVSDHVSRALSADLARQADYVFVMTRAHRDAVLRLAPQISDRVFLIMDDQDVPDPLGGPEADLSGYFAADAEEQIDRLLEITFTQNMKSMEVYYRWLSLLYAQQCGKIHRRLIETLFRYNSRPRMGSFLAKLESLTEAARWPGRAHSLMAR